MIYWTVTLTVTPGKDGEAIEWLKKLAQQNRALSPDADVELCELMDGAGGRYIWIERHKSMAAWEEDDLRFRADAEAKELLGQALGLFTMADTHFWRTVDLSA